MTPDIYLGIVYWCRTRPFTICGWVIGLLVFIGGWFL